MYRRITKVLAVAAMVWGGTAYAEGESGGSTAGSEAHLFDDLNADGSSDTVVPSTGTSTTPSREAEDYDQSPIPDPVEEQ